MECAMIVHFLQHRQQHWRQFHTAAQIKIRFAVDQYVLAGVQGIIPCVLYREASALHKVEFEHTGFEWVDCHDASQSVLSYVRKSPDGDVVVVILNFTPVPRTNYRIGLPCPGFYREALNSDSERYGGSNLGNAGGINTEPVAWMDQGQSAVLTLPPLGAVVLEWKKD